MLVPSACLASWRRRHVVEPREWRPAAAVEKGGDGMASERRIAGPESKNRGALLDAAEDLPPVVATSLIVGTAQLLSMHASLGLSGGRDDIVEFFDRHISKFDGTAET